MKPKRRQRTALIAADIAAAMLERLPSRYPVDPADLLNAVWPVAVRLERLEHAGTTKAARKYRRLRHAARAEAGRLLAMQDGAPARLADLRSTVPFLAPHWRLGLTPACPAVLMREEAA